MAATYDERSLAFFAADFRPDFGDKLPTCAELIYKKYMPDDVAFHPGLSYAFKWWGKRKLMILNNTRFACQTLGVDVWRDGFADFAGATNDALQVLEATQLKRIGFKVIAFLRQSMSHAELADLFFGTFLCPADEWKSICDTPTDPLIQLTGDRAGMKFQMILTATNTEQATQTMLSIPNLEHFGKNRVSDPFVREFIDKVTASPALMVDVDLYREDVPKGEANTFMKDALKAADEMIDASLAKLLSKAKQ